MPVFSILECILLFSILSLDCFVILMEKGAVMARLDKMKSVFVGLVFGIVCMVSLFLGNSLADIFIKEKWIRWNLFFAGLVFFVLATTFLINSLRKKKYRERLDTTLNMKKICSFSILTCIDTFICSMGIHFAQGVVPLDVYVVGFGCTFLFSVAGLWVGHHYGAQYQRAVRFIAAVLLYVLAFHLLTYMI